MITVLIVDDEIGACEGLEILISNESDFKVIGTSRNGDDAAKDIQSLKPDVVFLDIQMPGKNGFEVLEALSPEELPLIVFITAYDEYALDAFNVHALDYIQKPFTDKRFNKSLDYIRTRVMEKPHRIPQGLKSLLEDLKESVAYQPKKLKFRSSGKIYFVDTNDIAWIEGFDYYIKIHIQSKFHLVRDSLNNILNQLPAEFVRIHKSAIINKNSISSIEPLSRGNYQINLTNGKQLAMSKKYRDMYPELF